MILFYRRCLMGVKLDAVNNVMPSIPIHIVDSSYYAGVSGLITSNQSGLEKNDTYRCAQAPMRLYHCSGDEVVPFAHSEVAKDSLIARGSTSIELIDVGANYNHVSCADVCFGSCFGLTVLKTLVLTLVCFLMWKRQT